MFKQTKALQEQLTIQILMIILTFIFTLNIEIHSIYFLDTPDLSCTSTLSKLEILPTLVLKKKIYNIFLRMK